MLGDATYNVVGLANKVTFLWFVSILLHIVLKLCMVIWTSQVSSHHVMLVFIDQMS